MSLRSITPEEANEKVNNKPLTIALTTIDNPFNPFEEFDRWKEFDEAKGYYTCEYLARVAKTSFELSELDDDFAIESAIDEIVELNILGLYKKIILP